MDIEERKAFEENTKAKYPGALLTRVKSGAYYNWHVDSAFNGWLDAKRHAAEMAKPTVRIVYNIVKSAEQENFGDILFDGQFHKTSCVDWAHKNGYRVVE